MRILIAEDDEALAKFVRQGLEGEHFAVDVFKDGEQALAAGLACDYEIVIRDLNLPKLDGVGVRACDQLARVRFFRQRLCFFTSFGAAGRRSNRLDPRCPYLSPAN